MPLVLPRWHSGKESACHCRIHGFDPWVRKIPWRSKWQPTPVFLPGKPNGQRSLVGLSPWGHKWVGHDLTTKQQKQIFLEHSDYQKCYHLPTWQTFILLITNYMSGTGLSPWIKKTIIFAPTLAAFAISFLNMHKCIIWLLWCIHIFEHYSKNSVISEI